MLTKKDIQWEKVKVCPLCKKNNKSIFLKNIRYWENDIDFNLSKCKKCDFIFLNPRPIKKNINLFYKKESYWGFDLEKEIKKTNLTKTFGPIYNLINTNKKAKIFDLGAGTGGFLMNFKKLGWRVDGVEYSAEAVKFAKDKLKIKLETGDFLEYKINNKKYDYVVINNVLEHLYHPRETLIKVNKILEENGKLIIAVPNIDSLGFKIFKNNWYPLQPPIHLTQFSPNTIKLILEDSGFKVIKIYHKYPIHSEFSLFESYRSKFTKRNQVNKKVKVNEVVDSVDSNKNMIIIKKAGVFLGHLISRIISNLGYLLRRGENIIIYAEKK